MEIDSTVSEFPPGFEDESQNLAVDFDGVIHNNDRGFFDGTCYGELIQGSYESLEYLSKHFKIIIFTAKAKPSRPLIQGKTGVELVWEWLDSHKLSQFVEEVTSEKPRATAYLDDKAIRFTSWETAVEQIKSVTQKTPSVQVRE
jgi:hypothetical protein